MYGSIFAVQKIMKQLSFLKSIFTVLLLSTSYCVVQAQMGPFHKESKITQILYFNPEVYPDIEEIKEPTYTAFFSALSDQFSTIRNTKLMRVDYNIPFDDAPANLVSEFCVNNNAQFAVVPKVKYFKVGIGKYVFSNQVIISLKIYDATGEMVAETSYDTYKKNGRLLGSAENSIKIGTNGALKNLTKMLRKKNRSSTNAANPLDDFATETFTFN